MTGPAKIGHVGTRFLPTFSNFTTHNVLHHYAMELQLSAVSKHLIGIIMQVTEWKYTFPVLRYDL